MAVDDLYLVRYLITSTQPGRSALCWREGASGSWLAEINGVRLCLFHSHEMGSSSLCLKLTGPNEDVAFVEEPRSSSLFSRRYRNSGDLLLAEALRALADLITAQGSLRQSQAVDRTSMHREALFRRVLFGAA